MSVNNNICENNTAALFSVNDVLSLTVNDKGELVRRTFLQRVKFLFVRDDKLRDVISNTVKSLCNKRDNKPRISNIFFNKLSRLDNYYFNRREVNKNLQNFLSDSLKNSRDRKAAGEGNKLKRKVEKARLALRLGVKPKKNKGANGSVILKDLNGKNIGIFKPNQKNIGLIRRIKRIFGQTKFLSSHKNADNIGEVAAFEMDQEFGFGLTPATDIATIESNKGSFQLFVSGYKEAKNKPRLSDKTAEYTERELDIFQRMTIFDYLLGNLDRHSENWFVRTDENGKIDKIVTIDNGNSFPYMLPGRFSLSKTYQYDWKKFHISQERLTEESKRFIREELTEARLDNFINKLKEDAKYGTFLDKNIEINLRSRFSLLKELNFISPHDLGNI